MKAHRLAEYFPILEGEEFDALVKDIKDNGQLEPIITYHGEILDGVNRYRACQELGITPKIEEYLGNDPLSYVISANIRRRHMTKEQRAALALEMEPEFFQEAKERKETLRQADGTFAPSGSIDHNGELEWGTPSREKVAHEFGVSGIDVQRAKRIKREAPERFENIKTGKEKLYKVDADLREKRAAEKRAVKTEKEEEQKRQDTPNEVKAYMDALKEFKQALITAIKVAQYGKFSPEAIRFTIRKHDEIINLFSEFEEFEIDG